ncbi:hypothetical protein [Nocardioides jensenii]|uniref:hypothetical protein n=1 Tax=Nocardioides jensenii TaxID=1843 RepID=UPI000834A2A6|nr:hypothetical protein [Nocardioides jensenii]
MRAVAHRVRLAGVVPSLVLALALALSACGSDSDGDETDTRGEDSSQTPTTDPSGTGTPSSSGPSGSTDPGSTDPGSTDPGSTDPGSVDFDEVAILHATGAGGESSTTPVVLDSPAAVADFVAPFTRGDLGQQVRATVTTTKVPADRTLVGSVISIGCDVPPGVNVTAVDGVTITAQKVASPLPECFAPVTTVALVLVDSSALR